MRRSHVAIADTWRSGDAWFQCDRCGQRWRRSRMLVEWTELRVCPACIDPRPPQLTPPNVYPEGIPFPDARPQQDNGDLLMDDTAIYPGVLGEGNLNLGGPTIAPSSGQDLGPGAISPLTIVSSPEPVDFKEVVVSDVGFLTGLVFPPENEGG